MVLIWGLPGDDPLEATCSALTRCKAEYTLLDQRQVLSQSMECDPHDCLSGEICSGATRIPLRFVEALYTRVYDTRKLNRLAAASHADRARALQFETALWAWADETPAFVVNRPSAMASNNSKPHQMRVIEAAGFLVPDTLITTEPQAALEFWERHGQVIYKSISAERSIVSRLRHVDRQRLPDVEACPTQFQAFISGRDYRVHVIGDDIFAAEVVCEADDYRYARRQGSACELRSARLPGEIASRSYEISRTLDLPVCGIDLRRSPEGEWYCFEVNPSPCFTFYEHYTGESIADAIAALLHRRAR